MNDVLKLHDLYEVLLSDMEKLPRNTELYGSTLSSLLTNNMSPMYVGKACVFLETDHDHTFNYFLSNIEGLDFRINKEGMKINANINRIGRQPEYGSETFYELVKNKISEDNLNKLLKSRKRVLGSGTLQKTPIVQIMPKVKESFDDKLFLIKDGNDYYTHTF